MLEHSLQVLMIMASREKMVKVERENEDSNVPAIKNFMMLWIWIIPEISLYFFF
jgi:hypothetical protein